MALETRNILREDGIELAVLEIEGGVLITCKEVANAEYSISGSDLQGVTRISDEEFEGCETLRSIES